MKKYLLPKTGNFYKANLHCHTTTSDGKLTPEEVKREYMKRGYSIVAYTDHNTLLSRAHLTDGSFLALNGIEIDVLEPDWVGIGNHIKVCHIRMIALDPDNVIQPCFHRTKHIEHKEIHAQIKFDETKPDFERKFSPECINTVIKEGRDNGFFVTYNHPMWSLEDYRDYSLYHGMHAMEICNYSSHVTGMTEYNSHVYDDLLRLGNRIYCIGADDNHNDAPLDDKKSDSFGAFTVIKAEKLDYKTVTNALLKGSFYASQGPVIKALWVEDGVIHIECEEAECIKFNTYGRRRHVEYATDKKALTSAEFSLKEEDVYVRVTVIDKQGKCANTSAYFVDEILK